MMAHSTSTKMRLHSMAFQSASHGGNVHQSTRIPDADRCAVARPPQPYIGDFILRQQPSAVVVETAVTPEHGAKTGNEFRCADGVLRGGGGGFFPRMFCHVAAQLADMPDPAASALWRVRLDFCF